MDPKARLASKRGHRRKLPRSKDATRGSWHRYWEDAVAHCDPLQSTVSWLNRVRLLSPPHEVFGLNDTASAIGPAWLRMEGPICRKPIKPLGVL